MKREKSQEMFDGFVRNGIDFLRRSLDELGERPKYSVINFCSSIEIFLKARLMLEHWSLIDEEPGKASLTRFLSGDFRSVGIVGVIDRLQNIAGVRITQEAQKSFALLRDHRNKLLHSFHPRYTHEQSDEIIEGIVLEQTTAWFHLHRLLTDECRREFTDYLVEIEDLHRLIRAHHGYLQAKFESLLPDIEKGKKRGIVFSFCKFCGFEAAKENSLEKPRISLKRLVCENLSVRIELCCSTCDATIEIHVLGQEQVSSCRSHVDVGKLIDAYCGDQDPEERAYCSECGYKGRPSVVNIQGDWVCLSCLTWHEAVQRCGWCGEYVTGDVGDNYLPGCIMCVYYIMQESDQHRDV